MMKKWEPSSWRDFRIKQLPEYPDRPTLARVENELKTLPGLVPVKEILSLQEQLCEVADGKAILLQGGDCAESFAGYNENSVSDTLRVILQMALLLSLETKKPVVKMARMAGQFAKPRSEALELQGGLELPSYRGDIINDVCFQPVKRTPDPQRMIAAYSQSAATLKVIRDFAVNGRANYEDTNSWNSLFLNRAPETDEVGRHGLKINKSVKLMELLGRSGSLLPLKGTNYFTCHEALLLPYEEALTRTNPIMSDEYYGSSAHFLWIGERTRFIDSAHVEFCRGILNPIGIKCGPALESDKLIRMLDILNPGNVKGRLTLITRLGQENVESLLPHMIREIQQEGREVIWACDPMHGNTIKSSTGVKTRIFAHVVEELQQTIQIHANENTLLGGLHLEMTGEDVTECVGGMADIAESDLLRRYRTHCDPRLNAKQAIELALLAVEKHSVSVEPLRN